MAPFNQSNKPLIRFVHAGAGVARDSDACRLCDSDTRAASLRKEAEPDYISEGNEQGGHKAGAASTHIDVSKQGALLCWQHCNMRSFVCCPALRRITACALVFETQ